MEYRYVPISESISIAVPKDATPEEEAARIDWIMENHNPFEAEIEYAALLKEAEAGKLFSFEEILKELGALDQAPPPT